MQEAFEHPLSTKVFRDVGLEFTRTTDLCRFHGRYQSYRDRIVTFGSIASVDLMSWGVGSEEATYEKVLNGILEHHKALSEKAKNIRRRYPAFASSSAVSVMSS